MPHLATANDYVTEWGYLETGQLLTRIDVVDDTAVDTVTAMTTEINENWISVKAALDRVLERAETEVRIHTETRYGYPPTKDGFSTAVHPILKYATLVIARFYLHDQVAEREDIPSVVSSVYEQYLGYLKQILKGEIELENIDETEAKVLYIL